MEWKNVMSKAGRRCQRSERAGCEAPASGCLCADHGLNLAGYHPGRWHRRGPATRARNVRSAVRKSRCEIRLLGVPDHLEALFHRDYLVYTFWERSAGVNQEKALAVSARL